jgi:phospholipid/cholesterol/gamma-HCH transport system permease protein
MAAAMVGTAAADVPQSGWAGRGANAALFRFVDAVGETALLARDVVRTLAVRRPAWTAVVEQLEQIGWRSLSIVALTALSTGMVLALQLGTSLERFGAKIFVSRIVGLSLVREMGPVLTALMIGGRVGAGITAELGTMAVTEQVDAIRALGASPVRTLVAPRMIAIVVMLPALTVLANLIGIVGGLVISVTELRVDADFYWSSLLQGMVLADVCSGIGKTFFFAAFIGLIACRNGLAVTGGADGVGRSTTATVVAASITVLVSDFFLTKLFMLA